jgi:hypothetical protein
MPKSRKSIWIRIIVWGAMSVLLLGCLGVVALKAAFNSGKFDAFIRKKAAEAAQIDVSFERATYQFPAAITVTRPKVKAVAAPPGTQPLACDRLTAYVDLAALPEFRVAEVELQELDASIRLDKEFRPEMLPGGLGALGSRGPEAGPDTRRSRPSLVVASLIQALPFAVSVRGARLGVTLPDGEQAKITANASVTGTYVQQPPALRLVLEGAAEAYGTARDFGLSGLLQPEKTYLSSWVSGLGKAEGLVRFSQSGDAGSNAPDSETVEMHLDVEAEEQDLARIRQFLGRFGLILPPISGYVAGKVTIDTEVVAPAFVPTSLAISPVVSLRNVVFPVTDRVALEAERLSLEGKVSVDVTGPQPRFRWSGSSLSVAKAKFTFPGVPELLLDKVHLSPAGHVTAGRLSVGGKFLASKAGETGNGGFDAALGPVGLLVNSLWLQWPSLGCLGAHLATDPGITTAEMCAIMLQDFDLAKARECLADLVPADLRKWWPKGKLDGFVVLENLPMVSEDWAKSLKDNHLSVRAKLALVDGDDRLEAVFGGGVEDRCLRLNLEYVDLEALLGRFGDYVPAAIRELNPSGLVSGSMTFRDIPLPWAALQPGQEKAGTVTLELYPTNLRLRTALAGLRGSDGRVPELRVGAEGHISGEIAVPGPPYALGAHKWEAKLDLSPLEVGPADRPELSVPSARVEVRASGAGSAVEGLGTICFSLPGGTGTGSVLASLSDGTWQLVSSKLEWPEMGALEFAGSYVPRTGTVAAARFGLRDFDVGHFAERFGKYLPQEALSWNASGKVSLTGEIENLVLPQGRDATERPRPAPFRLSLETGQMNVRKSLPALKLVTETPEVKAGFSGSVAVSGRLDIAGERLEALRLESLQVAAKAAVPVGDKELSVGIKVEAAPETVELQSLEVKGGAGVSVSASAKGRRRQPPNDAVSLSFAGELAGDPLSFIGLEEITESSLKMADMDLKPVFGLLAPFLPSPWNKYVPSGTLSVDFQAKGFPPSLERLPKELAAGVQLRKASLLPTDENAVEGIENLDLDFTGRLRRREDALLDYKVSAALANALVYRDVFLRDFADRKVEMSSSGQCDPEMFRIRAGKGAVALPSGLRVEIEGLDADVAPEVRIRTQAKLTVPENDRFLAELRAAIGETWHWLNVLAANGQTTLDVGLDYRPGQFQTQGVLEIKDADIQYGDSALKGTNLRLPFSLGWPKAPEPADALPFGLLQVNGIRSGPFSLGALRLPLKVEANRLATEALDQDFLAGKLKLTAIRTTDLLSEERSADGKLTIEGAELGKLFPSVSLPNLLGTMNVLLDRVAFSRRGLDLSGNLRLNACGGVIEIKVLGGFPHGF